MLKLSNLTTGEIGIGIGGLSLFTLIVAAVITSPSSRAKRELKKWLNLKESDPAASKLLADYWKAVGLPPQPASTAWSAAFISKVAGKSLKPSANHIGYARAAWKARQANQTGQYWAYQPTEITPKKDDIVIRGRGQPVGWGDVVQDTGHKDSHGDVIADVKAGRLVLIGGNVDNSVTEKQYDGLPQNTFAILRKA